MDDATFTKCQEITDQIFHLSEDMTRVTPAKRVKIQNRITKLRAKRHSLLGLDKVSSL